MDANSAKLLKQLKKYNREAEKYERLKQATQARHLRRLGDLNKKKEKLLTQAGLDVPVLLREAQESAKILSEAQQAALALEAPAFPGKFIDYLPDPNVLDVRPPAVDSSLLLLPGLPDNTEHGFNLAAGQIHFKTHADGKGIGIMGNVVGTAVMTLVFQFIPPKAGVVQVDALVDFKGTFAVWVQNEFWNSPEASFRLHVSSRLYQDHWISGPRLIVLHEEVSDSSIISGWIDRRLWRLTYTADISVETPVLIFVETKWEISASGVMSAVEVDFGAPKNWVRVPAIFFRYL